MREKWHWTELNFKNIKGTYNTYTYKTNKIRYERKEIEKGIYL